MSAIAPSKIKLSPVLEIARQVLTEHRKAMHVNDIAAVAITTNRNLGMSQDQLAIRLGSALSTNVKAKSPSFTKTKNKTGGLKRGIYRVKQGGAREIALVKQRISAPKDVGTNFIGKAGEHGAMSELLFWGYNASLMSVDEGIDIVASKAGHYFHIQVKSSAETQGGRFAYKIKSAIFTKHHALNTFYFFIMRRERGFDFAILPSTHLQHLIGLGVISGKGDYSITITSDDRRRVYRLNNTDDISLYVNNIAIK